MSGDAKQFELEIKREFLAQIEAANAFVRTLALSGLRSVVLKSPVDTGRFRANWHVSTGGPITAITEGFDKSGAPTIAKGSTAIGAYASLENFPPIVIQNNLPYAVRLENGYSAQAPAGMVALAVAELQAIVNTAGPL